MHWIDYGVTVFHTTVYKLTGRGLAREIHRQKQALTSVSGGHCATHRITRNPAAHELAADALAELTCTPSN